MAWGCDAPAVLAWTALLLSIVAAPTPAGADAPAKVEYRGKRIAVVPFDALGIDPERVAKLESLFRNELERMAGRSGPTRKQVAVVASSRRLVRCAGQTSCLAEIGRRVSADLTIAGNVAALGDSYVVNIKAIDVGGKNEVNRVASDPLKGSPDELIEAVRIAAYRLLAPDQLRGSIVLLADVQAATVILDGKVVGSTPLPGPIRELALGKHKLSVTKDGYSKFAQEIVVRFQKTTKVVVRLAASDERTTGGTKAPNPLVRIVPIEKKPRWYQSTWFIASVGVAAITAGAIIGWQLGRDEVVDCSRGQCAP